jgi:hypothetical protein
MAWEVHMTQLVCNDLEGVATFRAASLFDEKVVPDVLAHEHNGCAGKIAESFDSLHEAALRNKVPIVRHKIHAIRKATLYC